MDIRISPFGWPVYKNGFREGTFIGTVDDERHEFYCRLFADRPMYEQIEVLEIALMGTLL